jgi:hypothetical protein
MATTNSTSNFNLSQYSNNDKVNFLVNYNSDMVKIDTAIQENKVDIASVETSVSTATTLANTAKDIAESGATSIVTLTNDVNAIETSVSVIQGNVSNLTTTVNEIGDTVLLHSTVSSGAFAINFDDYQSISIKFIFNGNGAIMKTYPVDALVNNDLIQDGHYLDATYQMSFNFTKTSTGITLNGWVLNNWSFNECRIYGTKR